MDYQEAIEHCKEVSRKNRKNNVRNTIVITNHWISSAHCAEEHEQIAEWLEELKQYRALGTVKELREAKEKQIAKKPLAPLTFSSVGTCPACSANQFVKHKYCGNCGQRLE